MRLVIIDNGKVELRDVETLELEILQAVVGGYIEPVFTVPSMTRPGYALTGYANDDGLDRLAPNVFCPPHQHAICGPVAIAALDHEGETVEPTDEELRQIALVGVNGCGTPILLTASA